MLTTTSRMTILAALLVLAFSSAADARTRAIVHIPRIGDEVFLGVTVGPAVRGNGAIAVGRRVPRDAYRYATASAPDPRNRRREANAFVFQTLEPDAFASCGCVPLTLPSRVGGLWMLDVPWGDGKPDVSAIARVPMPKFARRAVNSLIDTNTGEISWADE